MNQALQYLVELQAVDRKIISLKSKIEDIPSRVKTVERPLIEANARLESSRKRYDDLLGKKKDKEFQLDDISGKIDKLKARTSGIKTNKEYQAHLKEVEQVENERSSVEDDILIMMEQADEMLGELRKAEESVKEEEARIEEFRLSLARETEELERELDLLRSERTDIAGRVDKPVYESYMRHLEDGQGVAVVEVKDEICQGCFMNIPPQLYVEVRKSEEIQSCPQCQRFLYFMKDD